MKKLTDKMTLPKQFKMTMVDVGSVLNINQNLNYYYTLDLDGAPPLEYKGWIYIKRE